MSFDLVNLTSEVIDDAFISVVVNEVSKILDIEDKVFNIVLTDNTYIRKINREYRNIDRETDVISFAFLDNEENKDIFLLGEIYISLDKAHSQSEEYGHSFERELGFLLVHGILHLLGYDHMNKKEEKVMFGLQEIILESIGVER